MLLSQNLTDALRYSYLIPAGTARVAGVGGAFGAMGGDFGVAGINVSGIADYRSNEIMFSMSYNSALTESALDGSSVSDNSRGNEFQLENVGFVRHSKPFGKSFRTSNIAVGLQQYNNYNQVFSYNTVGSGSIVNRFAWQANIDEYSAFEAELADLAGAIYYDEQADRYLTDVELGQNIRKEQTVQRSGRFNELNIAWAGKLKMGLNLGLGVGVPFSSFQEDKFYEENDDDGDPAGFNKLNYNERLSVSGVGINLKAGLGYSILINKTYNSDSLVVGQNMIRLGLAHQTATRFNMDDNFDSSLAYDCELCLYSGEVFLSPSGSFDYRLKTPARTTGSVGALLSFGKLKSFLNLDAQYVNYTKSEFDFTVSSDDPADAQFQSEVNGDIDLQLGSAINFHLGGELAYDRYRLRGGVAKIASPFDGDDSFDDVYSAGLGYRANAVYIDFAYQYRQLEEGYAPYQGQDPANDLSLTNRTTISKVIMTLGIKL